MKRFLQLSALPALALGAFIASSASANAAIVCNGEGQCWHVPHPYRYARAYGLVVHPDTWRWGPNEHYVWREHPGRGYWRGGTWIVF
jgi:hypothetical protein